MKALVNLIVVAAAGFLGYAFEPNLRLELTGISHVPAPPKAKAGNPEEQILSKVNIGAYSPEQYPKEVTLKKPAQVSAPGSEAKMTLEAGTKVTLVKLDTGALVISPIGIPNVTGTVEIHHTDFREQLLAVVPAPATTATTEKPKPMDAMAKNEPAEAAEPAAPAEPAKPADAMAKAEPADTTAPGDPAMKEPTEGANPALAPEKPAEPAPAAPTEFAALAQDEIVKIMQESIKSGQVKSFKLEDVSEWTSAEPEELNGVKYNIGMVTYTGTTFMGKSQLKGKAFISGGKVTNWINPKSGTDLK
ncbi:MAG TPA: hypothetical protein VM511_00790 [Luteolibacter sp.]|nr:hypothetical protein [Luteolibacter sp.]